MSSYRSGRDAAPRPSIQSALSDVVSQGHQLLINRLDLMQVELRHSGERAVGQLVDLAVGLLLAFAGFVMLNVAGLTFLALYIGQPWACLAVGGVYTVGGCMLILRARATPMVDVTTSLAPQDDSGHHGHGGDDVN